MIPRYSPANTRKRVPGVRNFPYGCGPLRNGIVTVTTSESGQSLIGSENTCVGGVVRHQRTASSVGMFKEVDSTASFSVATSGNIGSGRFVSPSLGSKVKPLSPEESINLIASQSRRRQLLVPSQRNSLEKKELSNAVPQGANTHKPTGLIRVMRQNRITQVLSPREKVFKVLRLFKFVYKELDRDKAARRGETKTATSRIDYQARTVLIDKGKQVNAEKMIGIVPGIEIGDDFQYKSELNLVGLHFNIRGGIDYMNRGNLKLATSIVSAEGNAYSDKFASGVLAYTGEGGDVTKDQKLVRGNLALANSMRETTPVRVILGKTRFDQKGKHYVYGGLYLVENYWRERGLGGNLVFKFKLVRISGQLSVGLKR